jgi:hypothetical protein
MANEAFDEIQVFESMAERTGNQVARTSIRGRMGVCRSLSELNSKFRRYGDGFYYLARAQWPDEVKTLDLRGSTWRPLS